MSYVSGRKYSNQRLRDFAWGVNTRNSPNEIQDKQGVEVINFDSIWNKLISHKSFAERFSIWTWETTVLVEWAWWADGDVYSITNWRLYRDWTQLATRNFSTDSDNFLINMRDFVLVLDWTDRPFYYNKTTSSFAQVPDSFPSWSKVWAYYKGQLYIAVGDQLHIGRPFDETDITDVFTFTGALTGVQIVGTSRRPITAIAPWETWLYVFTENETYRGLDIQQTDLRDNDWNITSVIASIPLDQISNNWTRSKFSIQNVEQEILFYDDITQLHRRVSYEKDLTTLRDVAIWKEVETFTTLYPRSLNDGKVISTYKYPLYKTYFSEDWRWVNDRNIALCYNVDTKSWFIQNDKTVRAGGGRFFSSILTTWVIFEESVEIWEETTPLIEWEFLSKEYDQGDAIDNKRYVEMEFGYRISRLMTAEVDIIVWGELITTRAFNNSLAWTSSWGWLWSETLWKWTLWQGGSNQPLWLQLARERERIPLYNPWDAIQFRLRYSWIGYFELFEANINYKFIKAFRQT